MNKDNLEKSDNPFAGAPVIFSYTRAQAIEDGVLVDLTEWAKETGFRIPVACTAAVWNGYIVPPKETEKLGQSIRGRAHDVLWMLYLAIRGSGSTKRDQLQYEVIFVMHEGKQETVMLKAMCGPGDNGEPVLTVMRPDED